MSTPDFSQNTALVVDDDEFSRELVESVLYSIGVGTVWTAAEHESAMSIARIHKPDFVLLDIYMPDKDGWEVFDQIRRRLPDTAIIMITGSNLPADFGKSMGKNVDGYCIKPVLPDVMRKLLHTAQERHSH